jgi:phosphomethylpyrimidine synthase
MSNTTNKTQTRRQKRQLAAVFLKNVSDQSFPNSKKVYVQGEIHDIKVGMREITLTDTLISSGKGASKDTPVYEKMNHFVFMILLVFIPMKR